MASNPAPDLKKVLPRRTVALLEGIGGIASQMGAEAYLVGGLVRDLFLEVEHVDLDISVVGDGLTLARRLAKTLSARIHIHERFLTATLIGPDDLRVDVATARSERYVRPGALPIVAPASLQEDLSRRDITINAMAAALHPRLFGAIHDPFGGVEDLQAGVVRIMHAASLRDDPTRIVRMLRFASRFGFHLEEETRRCLDEALANRVFNSISPDRLRAEIYLALEERDPGRVFGLMFDLGVLREALPGVRCDDGFADSAIRAQRISDLIGEGPGWEPKLVTLILLLQCSSQKDLRRVAERLNLRGREAVIARGAWRLKELLRITDGLDRQSELHEVLRGELLETQLALLAIAKAGKARRKLLDYIRRSRMLRPELTGDDLAAMGVPPGPSMRKILSALLAAKLDGKLKDLSAEENFVKRTFVTREGKSCHRSTRSRGQGRRAYR